MRWGCSSALFLLMLGGRLCAAPLGDESVLRTLDGLSATDLEADRSRRFLHKRVIILADLCISQYNTLGTRQTNYLNNLRNLWLARGEGPQEYDMLMFAHCFMVRGSSDGMALIDTLDRPLEANVALICISPLLVGHYYRCLAQEYKKRLPSARPAETYRKLLSALKKFQREEIVPSMELYVRDEPEVYYSKYKDFPAEFVPYDYLIARATFTETAGNRQQRLQNIFLVLLRCYAQDYVAKDVGNHRHLVQFILCVAESPAVPCIDLARAKLLVLRLVFLMGNVPLLGVFADAEFAWDDALSAALLEDPEKVCGRNLNAELCKRVLLKIRELGLVGDAMLAGFVDALCSNNDALSAGLEQNMPEMLAQLRLADQSEQ
ncbi:hypothetical protein PAPHI01_0110 [Pancytospora philotis]|nr:hypothetical protein PAPHI01_0110 [Pancytospora philotis]